MLKVCLASLDRFYAGLIGDISFSGFLDLFNAVFIDDNFFSLTNLFNLYYLAIFIDLF